MKKILCCLIMIMSTTLTFSQDPIRIILLETFNQECQTEEDVLGACEKLIMDNLSLDLYGLRYLEEESVYGLLISGLLPNNSPNIRKYCADIISTYFHPHFIKEYSAELNDILRECDDDLFKQLSIAAVHIDIDSQIKDRLLSADYVSLFERAMLGDANAQKKIIVLFEKEEDFIQRLYLAKKVGCLKNKEALRVLMEEFVSNKEYNQYINYYSSKYIAIVGFQYYEWEPLLNNLGEVCNKYLFYKNQYSELDFGDSCAIEQKTYLLHVAKYLKKKYHCKIELKANDFLEYFEVREIDYDE